MGNTFTHQQANLKPLHISNGGTEVLMSVLLLSASDLAQTDWEIGFAIWIAEHDQDCFYGRGAVGSDIAEIQWDAAQFDQQKAFVLGCIDTAIGQHRWHSLTYKPNIDWALKHFRDLVAGFEQHHIQPPATDGWLITEPPFDKCPIHQVYLHRDGCLLCHDTTL